MEKLSIFSYLDYRAFIKDWVKYAKTTKSHLTQAIIAENLRVKGPFFSKVISGRANFNEDQLYLLGEYFNLSQGELEYLLLLSSFERSAIEDRKKIIRQKIKEIQERELSTEESISTQKVGVEHDSPRSNYYLDPYHLLVHVSLALEEYSLNPEKLIGVLGISKVSLDEILKNLKDLNLIYVLGDRFLLTETQLHLKSSEFLCKPHQNLMKQVCGARLLYPRKDDYNLALTFSCTQEDKEKIKAKFLSFLKDFDKVLDKAKDEKVYQMNFDLFNWA